MRRACSAVIRIAEPSQAEGLFASMQAEDAQARLDGDSLTVLVAGDNISDLRARLNSALRSLHAASEALISVDTCEGTSMRGSEQHD